MTVSKADESESTHRLQLSADATEMQATNNKTFIAFPASLQCSSSIEVNFVISITLKSMIGLRLS